MRITATKIAQWARTAKARLSLPRLIRRLVHTAGTPSQAAFPAGDSTALPGWDGEVFSESRSPWVPKGKSFWEFSCEAQVTKKANLDYDKRTKQTPVSVRKKSTLVVVTAQRWSQKVRWLTTKRKEKKWADIHAYDADDLEQWLEQCAPVAVQFGEELGLIGPGVESTTKHWDSWSQQSDPHISPEAFFIDRQDARARFVSEVRNGLQAGHSKVHAARADSVEEAAAFACASIVAHPDLLPHSVVVTSADGWRFVETNPSIRIAIAARPELAERPTMRNGLIVVIPYATGDMAGDYRGAAAATNEGVKIERPRIHEFETALKSLGLDDSQAKRLAAMTGRSWSVLRRHCAINPAIRRPRWLDKPEARALSTVCLLGGWSAAQAGDRDVVSRLADRPYEQIERELRSLSLIDDSPVISIADVWKAKSPLELLFFFGDRITNGELDRFFELAREILIAADPVLELPDSDRYAAQIFGKVRIQSGLLINSLCDTLIKLAAKGPYISSLSAAGIESRTAVLVRELLDGADGVRWLSLAALLPSLAEVAPDEFLRAVEASLNKTDSPVTQLISETTSSSLMGRCWHAGLLWALETLAWQPERLARVALILARLCHIEIKGNWGNTPQTSLLNIFRSWMPQTAADIDQRVAALDILITKESDVAFDLLDSLVPIASDSAFPAARPHWRDDDAGAGYAATFADQQKMLVAASDRLIVSAAGRPDRVARLVQKISALDKQRAKSTLNLVSQFTERSASDDAKQIVRDALRKKIYRLRNYSEKSGATSSFELNELDKLYESLSPADSVIRHKWLFEKGWPELPTGREKDHKKRLVLIDELRVDALQEIIDYFGMEGVERLAAGCANEPTVGVALAKLKLAVVDLAQWIVEKGGDFGSRHPLMMTIRSLLRASESPRSIALINTVLEGGEKVGWDPAQTARFLALASEQRSTWEIARSRGPEVDKAYWAITQPFWLQDDTDFEFALRRLVEANRPRTALQVCHFDLIKVEPQLLVEMLEGMLQGEEPEGRLLDSWDIGEALKHIETSGAIEKLRLIRLEFGLIPTLGYEGEQKAESLYDAIMSNPKLFCDVLCMLYKPASEERETPPSEAEKRAAQTVWRILQSCSRQPGTQTDGTIDPIAFTKFIDEARDLCRSADRLQVFDLRLGQILAHAPADAEGIWPFAAARDVLDRPEFGDIRRGLLTGVRNSHGSSSRAYDEGGDQERKLAEKYRNHALAVRNSHPNLAAAMERLARSYENDSLREDKEAELRREGL
jgi:hypothetical protein